MLHRGRLSAVWACLLSVACLNPGPSTPQPLEPPAPTTGDLRLAIAYPRVSDSVGMAGDTLVLRAAENQIFPPVDSVFLFGTVGRGDADLRVNGRTVEVYPTGGWIAWLPLDPDSVAVFQLEASAGGERVVARFSVPVAIPFRPPGTGVWIDTTSFSPRDAVWVDGDEGYELSVSAHPRAQLTLLFPDGSEEVMIPRDRVGERAPGELAFGVDATSPAAPSVGFVLWRRGSFGPQAGPLLNPFDPPTASDSSWVRLRAVVGADTVTSIWPLRVSPVRPFPPVVAYLDDDQEGTGVSDGVTPGSPSPSGTYHWFFPNGTVARVSGRIGSRARLQLSDRTVAWVSASELVELPAGTPPPRGTTRPIRLVPGDESVVLRVPLGRRFPFRVAEQDRALALKIYGVAADMDWLQYGGTDPLVRRMSFSQPASDEVVVTLELAELVWGYRTRWEGDVLLLEIRRPPEIDRRRPLRGLTVAVDAGHPPAGSLGPTLVGEWDVNLGVARQLRELLLAGGAEVLMIRDSPDPMGLTGRVVAAERGGADILISVHANALPDGVNPFTNSGTSVYYYQPRSAPLARELNRALVRQFGVRDLGFGRADLALARPTWMPAALTEGLFMMLPDQEAILNSEEGQRRYGRGIVEGLEAFLRFRLAAVRRR